MQTSRRDVLRFGLGAMFATGAGLSPPVKAASMLAQTSNVLPPVYKMSSMLANIQNFSYHLETAKALSAGSDANAYFTHLDEAIQYLHALDIGEFDGLHWGQIGRDDDYLASVANNYKKALQDSKNVKGIINWIRAHPTFSQHDISQYYQAMREEILQQIKNNENMILQADWISIAHENASDIEMPFQMLRQFGSDMPAAIQDKAYNVYSDISKAGRVFDMQKKIREYQSQYQQSQKPGDSLKWTMTNAPEYCSDNSLFHLYYIDIRGGEEDIYNGTLADIQGNLRLTFGEEHMVFSSPEICEGDNGSFIRVKLAVSDDDDLIEQMDQICAYSYASKHPELLWDNDI